MAEDNQTRTCKMAIRKSLRDHAANLSPYYSFGVFVAKEGDTLCFCLCFNLFLGLIYLQLPKRDHRTRRPWMGGLVETYSGYGLRETLFYDLFGMLKVYKTQKQVEAALSHISGGAAVSLDGFIAKDNGFIYSA